MALRLEDLEVYQLADDFSNKIWNIVTRWGTFEKDTVGKQLVRSADSISANIAEGYGRYHFKENKNFCYFSRGSIIETKGCINKAQKRNLISEADFQTLMTTLESIHIKLNAYIRSIGRQ